MVTVGNHVGCSVGFSVGWGVSDTVHEVAPTAEYAFAAQGLHATCPSWLWYECLAQLTQLTDPVLAWAVPAPQFEHELAPALEYFPPLQAPDGCKRPCDAQYEPAEHATQLDAPSPLWYMPTAHAVQAAALEALVGLKEPCGHSAQAVLPVLGWY